MEFRNLHENSEKYHFFRTFILFWSDASSPILAYLHIKFKNNRDKSFLFDDPKWWVHAKFLVLKNMSCLKFAHYFFFKFTINENNVFISGMKTKKDTWKNDFIMYPKYKLKGKTSLTKLMLSEIRFFASLENVVVRI